MEAASSPPCSAPSFLKVILRNCVVKVIGVTVEFGQAINHRERVKNKSIGGGGLMDIGIYVIQFALMAFVGREPLTDGVNAVGTKMESGADETGSLMLQFGEGKFAHLVYSCKVGLFCGWGRRLISTVLVDDLRRFTV